MSIRNRLTVAVALILAAGIALFATVSIFAIDRTLRSALDARVQTSARAVAAAVDVHFHRPDPDAGDRQQILPLRVDMQAAVYDLHHRRVYGNSPPAGVAMSVATVPIFRHGNLDGTVTAWASSAWIDQTVHFAILVSVLAGLVLIACGIVAARFAAEAAIAPLERIAGLAERIEARDLSLRLGESETFELRRLCASFDRMLDRLQAAFAHERRFTADASHELRAPLAVLRAETELALRRERSSEEYRRAFESIARESTRLESLVDDLLAAARADIDANLRESIDIGALMRDIAERATPPASLKGLDIVLDEHSVPDEHSVSAIANRALLERALLAVVDNAIAFAPRDGHVRMAVASDDRDVTIQIADNGPGFTSEALDHATERFWRGDGARPRGGTGLGLAIARAIVEANGGRFNLANAPNGGAIVTIHLTRQISQTLS